MREHTSFFRFRGAFWPCPVRKWKSCSRCILIVIGLAVCCYWIGSATHSSRQLPFRQANSRLPALLRSKSPSSDNPDLLFGMSTWKPNDAKLDKLLYYLNLTRSDVPSHLPVTLQGPELLSNKTLCVTEDGSPVDVLFVVYSTIDDSANRVQMRTTFLAQTYFRPFKIRAIFLLGRGNSSQQAALQQEQNQFRDLVQGDFVDHYHNLSLKGVMGFRWVIQHCAQARLVIKLDDDMFFDTYKLLHHYWVYMEGKKRSLFCYFHTEPELLRDGKWAIEERLFRNMSTYPYHYCGGPAVMMSGDLIPWLYMAAKFTPVFWVSDVYLFGILPSMASDIIFYDVDDMYGNEWNSSLECIENRTYDCPLLFVEIDREDLTVNREMLWNETMKLYKDEEWPFAHTEHV